jgi:DNA-binding NarL/FixJ family response regulator
VAEGLTLAAIGAVAGVMLAVWGLGALKSGDLFERDDLDAFRRIASMAALHVERLMLRAHALAHATASAMSSDWPSGGVAAGGAGQLTPRERQVLDLIARGFSNQRIAEHLVIGVRTVETHVERILRKLNVESRTQAVVWARNRGTLD